jgi:hypothetical protein
MLIIVVILVVGISMVAVGLTPNTTISSVEQNGVIVQEVNGVYNLPNSNISPVTISFSPNISIISLKDVSYSSYSANSSPKYVILGNEVQFLLLAFQPFNFDLHFSLNYKITNVFGIVQTQTETFNLILR